MDEQHRVKHKSIKPNDGNKEHNRTQKNTKDKAKKLDKDRKGSSKVTESPAVDQHLT